MEALFYLPSTPLLAATDITGRRPSSAFSRTIRFAIHGLLLKRGPRDDSPPYDIPKRAPFSNTNPAITTSHRLYGHPQSQVRLYHWTSPNVFGDGGEFALSLLFMTRISRTRQDVIARYQGTSKGEGRIGGFGEFALTNCAASNTVHKTGTFSHQVREYDTMLVLIQS